MNLSEKRINLLAPFISVLLGLLVGAIIILLTGNNPIEAYYYLVQGGFKGIFEGDFNRLGNTLLQATPLILTGLSVAFAFRNGLFNIGAGGQMLFGGFIAVYLGVTLDLPSFIILPTLVIAGTLGGALWAVIPGILKAKYRIHEVVTTIMMNYVAIQLVQYLVKTLIPGPFDTESARVPDAHTLRVEWLSDLFDGSYVNLGIFIALIAALLIWFVLEKTTFGYELKAVGFNKDASKYAGIKVNKSIMSSFLIAGGLAGLAGVTYYIGYTNHIKIGSLPSQGFDGIAIALLGLNAPIGVVISAFFFGLMKSGGQFMTVMTDVPNKVVDVIIAGIIYFSATSLIIKGWLHRIVKKRGEKK